MRLFLLLMLMTQFSLSLCKSVKTLTESMGQEVIELDAPVKELPLGLEEEPSAEVDDVTKVRVTTTAPPTSKRETKREKTATTTTESKKKHKDLEKIEEDEEARIEKELAEIYKDTDYKLEDVEEKEKGQKEVTAEATTTTTTELTTELTTEEETVADEFEEMEPRDKPVGRKGNNFKFQPDTTDKAAIERFRTSVDQINCNNRQVLSVTTTPKSGSPSYSLTESLTMTAATLCCIFIST